MSASVESHDVFQAIADPTRREVLRLLANTKLNIASIASNFTVSRTAIAKHLRVLQDAGLVDGQKSGREVIYQFKSEPLTEVDDWLSYYRQFWDDKLQKLKGLAEKQS